MIFLNKIFINFYRRKNQFFFLKNFFCNENVCADSARAARTLRTLSTVDFDCVRGAESRALWAGLEDGVLTTAEWGALCGAVRAGRGEAFLERRLPHVLAEALLAGDKARLALSFLGFVLGSERHRSPPVLLGLIESMAHHGRTELLPQYAALFREAVRADQLEVLLEKYVSALLSTTLRHEALELLRGRRPDHGLLRRVILTSPFTESWIDVKHYFEDYLSLNSVPDPTILEKIINKIPSNNVSNLTEFLDRLCFSKSHIWTKNITSLTSLAENFGLQMKLNSVKELSCDACGNNIPEICPDEKSCRDVADIIMIDVMKIESTEKLYENSSPSEILRFNSFIKTCKFPIDCVIDYLNLLFFKQRKNKLYVYDQDRSCIINCLLELNKNNPNIRNICLVGKKHNWSGMSIGELVDDIKYILKNHRKGHGILNVSYYCSDKITKDDVLALYIALKFGPNCFIVSNDEYRDHRAKIKDTKLKEFLKDWQSYRQILMNKEVSNSKMLLEVPPQYVKHVIYNHEKNIYHIPYAIYMEDKNVKTSFCTDVKWACLKC